MNRVHSILALDIATSTGFALLAPNGTVKSGTKEFALKRGESTGVRFLRFRKWLLEIIEEAKGTGYGPDLVVWERASFLKSRPAQELLHGLAGVLQEVVNELGLQLMPVDPSAVKRHATGSGNAKKPDMVAAATRRWTRTPGTEDEADALCVLAWAIDECGVKPAESAP